MFVTKATHQKEVGRLNSEIATLVREKEALRRELREERTTVDALDKSAMKFSEQRDAARDALTDIAAMETPGCAHIGRKMAARARQAIPARARQALPTS